MSKGILFVDDDPNMVPLVRALLERPGLKFRSAESGDQAVLSLAESETHLVVTDLDMPGMSGQELTQHISTNYPAIPVVVLTGTGNERTAIECFRVGAADYVAKANVHDELRSIVDKLLKEEEAVEEGFPEQEFEFSKPENDSTNSFEEQDTSPKNSSAPISKGIEEEYVVRKWGKSLKGENSDRGEEVEFTPERLRVLRRQCVRLDKWNDLNQSAQGVRRQERRTFNDIVFILPFNNAGEPDFSQRFISFCRNISVGGCSLMHSRLIRLEQFVIFLPHLATGHDKPAAIKASVVRDRPLGMGIYEIGVKFLGVAELTQEDLVLLTAASKKASSV